MKSTLYIISFLSLFLMRCTKQVTEITIPPHDPKISIGADLIVGSPASILTSTSIYSLSPNEPAKLDGAKVFLYENNVLVDTLDKDSAMYYIGDYIIKPGKEYKVMVEHSKYKTASGSTKIPKNDLIISDLIVSITEFSDPFSGQSYRYGQISFTLNQTLDNGQYYSFSINDEQNEVPNYPLLSNDIVFQNNLDSDPNGETYFLETSSDQIEKDTKVTILINSKKYTYEPDLSDELVLKINILNRDKKKYKDSFEKYENAQYDPFAEAVTIYNNIENGYGIVMGEYTEEIILKP